MACGEVKRALRHLEPKFGVNTCARCMRKNTCEVYLSTSPVGYSGTPSTVNEKTFLRIMCIDAPESTTNCLSSGLRVDGAGRHQFSEGEKNVVLCFSFNFKIFLASLHAASRHTALAIPSLLETDPQILEYWGSVDENHLGKSSQPMDSGLECQHDVTRL